MILIWPTKHCRYDTRADDWVRVSSLNHFRRLAEAVVLAGKIYVIGGFYNGNRLRSVERYDPRTDEWTDVAELNVARYYHRCCTINGSIYVVGGCSYRGRAISSIEQFDAQINKWTIVRSSHISYQNFQFRRKKTHTINNIDII